MSAYGGEWTKLLHQDVPYGNSFITRPYTIRANKENSKEYFERLKSLWEGRDIVVFEGRKTLMGVGNDLFGDVASIKRVLCPTTNAY